MASVALRHFSGWRARAACRFVAFAFVARHSWRLETKGRWLRGRGVAAIINVSPHHMRTQSRPPSLWCGGMWSWSSLTSCLVSFHRTRIIDYKRQIMIRRRRIVICVFYNHDLIISSRLRLGRVFQARWSDARPLMLKGKPSDQMVTWFFSAVVVCIIIYSMLCINVVHSMLCIDVINKLLYCG